MKILICEDDMPILEYNKALVKDYVKKRGIKNIDIISTKKLDNLTINEKISSVDIAILDIDLKDSLNGLSIAEIIKRKNPYVALIFITSYANFALDAWELHSCGYLKKPVSMEDFNDVFSKALLQLNGLRATKMNRMIDFSSKISIKERDIHCIEKEFASKDVHVTTSKGVLTYRGTLKDVIGKLCDSFVQINRATIINVRYIFKIESGVIELSDEKVFYVTSKKEKEVKAICAQLNS